MKAVHQYERESSARKTGFKEVSGDEESDFDLEETVLLIKPPPVLFTDTFRWYLVANRDSDSAQNRPSGLQSDDTEAGHQYSSQEASHLDPTQYGENEMESNEPLSLKDGDDILLESSRLEIPVVFSPKHSFSDEEAHTV